MIRLVLFDIDGTLIRTGGAGVRAFAKTFASEFKLPHATEAVRFAGRTDVSLVRQIFIANKIEPDDENFSRFFEHYPYWLDHYLHHLDGGPCEGVLDFIRGLEATRDKPILGLLTGNIRLGAELKLRRYSLWQHFAVGAFADDHEDRNCIAGIAFERGSKMLGEKLRGEEVVVIGDTGHDIECGKSIGAKTLAVATGGGKLHELRSHEPTWTTENLTQFRVEDIFD